MHERSTAVIRNFSGEFNAVVEGFLPAGDYIAAQVAAAVLGHLRRHDPELLAGYLDERAEALVTEELSHRRRLAAKAALAQAPRGLFRAAVAGFEGHLAERAAGLAAGTLGGDPVPLSVFAQHLVVNGRNLARPIGRMTRRDVLYVAEQYASRARSAELENAFYLAVAKRIPEGGVVADVMTEDQFLRLRDSIRAV
jgi:hypothetical protein